MNRVNPSLNGTRQSFRKTDKFIIKNAPTTNAKKLSVGPYPPLAKDSIQVKLDIKQQPSTELLAHLQANAGFSYDRFKKMGSKEGPEIKKPPSRNDLGREEPTLKSETNLEDFVKKSRFDEVSKKLDFMTKKYEELKVRSKTYETNYNTSLKKSEDLARENRTLKERIRELEARNRQLTERNNERASQASTYDTVEEAKIDINEVRSLRLAMRLEAENILMNQLSQMASLEMLCERPQRTVDLNDPTTINPDNMTYEELIQLGEKIGNVSRGLDAKDIKKIPKKFVTRPRKADENCSICFCEVEVGSKVRQLPCSHEYHSKCIKQWLVNEKSCPICKEEVKIS